MIYINKIENRITFKIKIGYYLEILMPETMKLLGSTESKITKDENGETLPHLEITEVVLIHCNIVNNNYQQDSRFFYTFVWSIIRYFTKNFIFLKTFNAIFSYIEVWFTDQNSKPLDVEHNINITLVIN